jgi:DNA-binding transcriptional regulator YiaG
MAKTRTEIGPQIAQYRQRYGLSQSQAAELLRISVNTLRNWEHGTQGCALAAIVLALLRFKPEDLRRVLH